MTKSDGGSLGELGPNPGRLCGPSASTLPVPRTKRRLPTGGQVLTESNLAGSRGPGQWSHSCRSRKPFRRRAVAPSSAAMCRIRVDEHLYSAVQHAPFPLRQFRAGIPISQELDDLGDPLSVTGSGASRRWLCADGTTPQADDALVEHYKERIGHPSSPASASS